MLSHAVPNPGWVATVILCTASRVDGFRAAKPKALQHKHLRLWRPARGAPVGETGRSQYLVEVSFCNPLARRSPEVGWSDGFNRVRLKALLQL
jgi:hypothetical protein